MLIHTLMILTIIIILKLLITIIFLKFILQKNNEKMLRILFKV